MKTMNYLRFAALMAAIVMTMTAQAKTQDWGGRVIDEKGEPMPFVNVVLLSLPDSTFVQGAMTDEQGMFKIVTNVTNGVFKVSSVGYQTLYINATRRGSGEKSATQDARQGRRHANDGGRNDSRESRNGERCPVEDSLRGSRARRWREGAGPWRC